MQNICAPLSKGAPPQNCGGGDFCMIIGKIPLGSAETPFK